MNVRLIIKRFGRRYSQKRRISVTVSRSILPLLMWAIGQLIKCFDTYFLGVKLGYVIRTNITIFKIVTQHLFIYFCFYSLFAFE